MKPSMPHDKHLALKRSALADIMREVVHKPMAHQLHGLAMVHPDDESPEEEAGESPGMERDEDMGMDVAGDGDGIYDASGDDAIGDASNPEGRGDGEAHKGDSHDEMMTMFKHLALKKLGKK